MIDFATLYLAATSNGFDPTTEQVEHLRVELCLWFMVNRDVYISLSGGLTTWPRGTVHLLCDGKLAAAGAWPSVLRDALRPWLGAWS